MLVVSGVGVGAGDKFVGDPPSPLLAKAAFQSSSKCSLLVNNSRAGVDVGVGAGVGVGVGVGAFMHSARATGFS